jgi:hypothetical protein
MYIMKIRAKKKSMFVPPFWFPLLSCARGPPILKVKLHRIIYTVENGYFETHVVEEHRQKMRGIFIKINLIVYILDGTVFEAYIVVLCPILVHSDRKMLSFRSLLNYYTRCLLF